MMVEFWRVYGDIFMISNGSVHKVIVICRLDWMRELFIQKADIFSGRPEQEWLINYLFKGRGALLFKLTLNNKV